MTTPRQPFASIFLFVLGLALVGATSCATDTTPKPGSDPQVSLPDDGASEGVETKQVVNPVAAVTLSLSTGAQVEVPAGAVEEDVEISVRRPPDSEALLMLSTMPETQPFVSAPYILTPHGQTFVKPVTMRFPIAEGADRDRLQVAYLENESDTSWELIGAPVVEANVAIIELDHFSVVTLVEADADGSSDAGTRRDGGAAIVDSGTPATAKDAGSSDAGSSDAGVDGGSSDAGSGDAGADAGSSDAGSGDAGSSSDAGADAGSDAGADAGSDAGADAGSDAGADAGSDAGADAGSDAGADAGAMLDGGASLDGGAEVDGGDPGWDGGGAWDGGGEVDPGWDGGEVDPGWDGGGEVDPRWDGGALGDGGVGGGQGYCGDGFLDGSSEVCDPGIADPAEGGCPDAAYCASISDACVVYTYTNQGPCFEWCDVSEINCP